MFKPIDLTGKKFNMLNVIGFHEQRKYIKYWKCQCDCGNIVIVCGSNVKRNFSCGCLRGLKHVPTEMCLSTLKDKFNKCLKENSNGCMEWQKGRDKNGYGIAVSIRFKINRAHRLSWFLNHGSLPENKWVLHKCDNPSCCNIDHLFLGDGKENSDDMIRKGRKSYPKRKLSKEEQKQVIEMSNNKITQREIAKKFNVCQWSITNIIKNPKEKG